MPLTTRTTLLVSTLLLCLGPSVQAASIVYNFDRGLTYKTGGVVGTFWDGVYLGNGDVPNGNNNGSIGGTIYADETTFAGYLFVQSTNTGWAGIEDDGFLLYKVVSGDFDVSVQVAGNYDNRPFNQSGLLVRAFTTNGPAWGAPFGTTVTNTENWVSINRFNEFSINDQYRSATNNNDIQITVDGGPNTAHNIATNDTRYFRITRVGNTFTVYDRTNNTDAWALQQTVTRGDLDGIPMQVGIHQAEFAGGAQVMTFYTDFELSGPNVTIPARPADATGLTMSAPDSVNGLATLSWTGGAGSAGTLVLLQRNKSTLTQVPINGFTFNGNTNLGSGDFFNGNRNSSVVYVGAGSSVTVSGLGGSNNTYTAYAFSYTGSGASIVYGTNPAVLSFPGPGIITNVSFTTSPTNLPVSGVGFATITAKYSTGDSYDVSSDPSAALISSDPNVILINNGIMNALALGAVNITASYSGFSSQSAVSVHTPVFSDNFGVNQDYVANGLVGSTWDGLYLNFGDVPGSNRGNDNAAGATSVFNANVNSNGVLSVEAAGSTWAVAGNDGPFLYKVVTGDFQASVHVRTMSIINNNDAGLMARLFNNTGTASQGGGGGAGGAETHINWVKVQNGTPAMRRTIDSGGTTVVNGLAAGDGWLLMQRVNSTNFLFFEKANQADPWNPVPTATMTLPQAANNAPMQIGILQEMRTASDGTALLDTLMIDGPGIVPPVTPPPPATNLTVVLNGNLSMTFSWIAASVAGAPIRSMLVMRAGAPVTAAPTLAQAGQIGGTANPVNFGTGVNLGGGNWMVFATGNPAASTNVACTVQGLTPGVVYYAVVYTFTGAGATKAFNVVVPPSGASTSLQDGALVSLEVLQPPPIPLGGLQVLQVIGHYQGGAVVNVSPFAQVTSGNPSVIVTTNGALSGIGLGTATVTVIYSGNTNVVNATVRAPGFTDNFNVNHDYVASRATGSPWDGVYLNYGDVPESTFLVNNVLQQGVTAWADANVLSNGFLTVTNQNGGWENAENDGFFLFKYVPADFQMAVHISQYEIVAFTFPGIGARAYSFGTNGTDIGAPFDIGFGTNGPANGECWVNFTRFDEFGIGTYPRLNFDNVVLQSIQLNPNNGDNWLLMIRDHGTNFNFYERATNTAPWRLTPNRTSYSVSQFDGQPMQVGIQWMTFNRGAAGQDFARFDSFMLDIGLPSIEIRLSGANVILSWPAAPGWDVQGTTSLSPANWQAVPGTRTASYGRYSLTLPASGGSRFFRLVH
jgi:hypothetical protein